MSTLVWQGFHRAGANAPFDHEAADREYERSVRAAATLEEARERVEHFEAQRPDIEADLERRRESLAASPPPRERRRAHSENGLVDDASPPPGAYERALEEAIQRRIDAAGGDPDRAFLIEAIGEMMAAMEFMDKRIGALEYDNLQLRGLLHEHGLAVRSLLPDPADDYAPRIPGVLARAGSRTLTERTSNRVWPSSDATPWFSQPYFNDED